MVALLVNIQQLVVRLHVGLYIPVVSSRWVPAGSRFYVHPPPFFLELQKLSQFDCIDYSSCMPTCEKKKKKSEYFSFGQLQLEVVAVGNFDIDEFLRPNKKVVAVTVAVILEKEKDFFDCLNGFFLITDTNVKILKVRDQKCKR